MMLAATAAMQIGNDKQLRTGRRLHKNQDAVMFARGNASVVHLGNTSNARR